MATPTQHIYLGPYIPVQTDGRRLRWTRPHEESLVGAISLRTLAQKRNTASVQGVGLFAYSRPVRDSALTYFGQGLDVTLSVAERNNWRALTGISARGTNLRALIRNSLGADTDPAGIASVPPVIPTHTGEWEIWLGGRIAGDQLTSKDALWNAVLLRLQHIYRERRAECHTLYDAGDPLRDRHKLLLGFWCRKYRRAFGGALPDYRIFLGSEPDEGVIIPRGRTTIGDQFPGVDSPTLGGNLTWTEVSGDFARTSQTAEVQTLGGSSFEQNARAASALAGDDMESYAIVSVLGIPPSGTTAAGASSRFAAAAEQFYAAGVTRLANGNMTYITIDVDGGAETQIGVNTGPEAASAFPIIMGCSPTGSSIRRLKNGAIQNVATDATLTGQTMAGINASLNVSSSVGDSRIATFWARDLVSRVIVIG